MVLQQTPSHLLHLVLTLLTFWIFFAWAVVWMLVTLAGLFEARRCVACGKPARFFSRSALGPAAVLMVLAFVGIMIMKLDHGPLTGDEDAEGRGHVEVPAKPSTPITPAQQKADAAMVLRSGRGELRRILLLATPLADPVFLAPAEGGRAQRLVKGRTWELTGTVSTLLSTGARRRSPFTLWIDFTRSIPHRIVYLALDGSELLDRR